MATFLVLADTDNPELGREITHKFPNASRRITDSQWAVSADMTAQALCEYLDADKGRFGRVIVVLITSYYGWHQRDLWDWLALQKTP